MAGRKPKPTAVKKLEGNPGKRKLNTKEPIPAKGMGLRLLVEVVWLQSFLKYETGICYSTEIACEGNIWQKDDTKCENFRCKAVPYKIATGRWEKLQFHSYHPGSAATSLSDGGG